MTDITIENIRLAIELIKQGRINKLEGKGWKVYRIGNIIRVDISESSA